MSITNKYYRIVEALLGDKLKKGQYVYLEVMTPSYGKWLDGHYKAEPGDYRLVISGKDGKALDTLAEWTLLQMPNCCGICISTKSFITEKYRGLGLGTVFNQWRMDISRKAGYSLLLCTDVEDNIKQRNILQTNGWKKIYNFLNKRTNNIVNISAVGL